ASRWVITAGHCFQTADGTRVDYPVARRTIATVGRTDLDSGHGQEVDVVAVHQAPTTDVALAELGTSITGVAPLRIGTVPPSVGETLRLTGYGLTAESGSTPATWLQTGQFTVEAAGDTLIET